MPVIGNALKNTRGDYTAGSPADIDSQGLQVPPEVLALITQLLVPGLPKAAGAFTKQLPGQVAGLSEAGAIFPEGANLPADRSLMQEFGNVVTDSRKKYLLNQRLADWHAQNMDFPAVLRDKWAMLTHAGGN